MHLESSYQQVESQYVLQIQHFSSITSHKEGPILVSQSIQPPISLYNIPKNKLTNHVAGPEETCGNMGQDTP